MELSTQDREIARDKTRQAWRALNPGAADDAMPEALRAGEPVRAGVMKDLSEDAEERPTRAYLTAFITKLKELAGIAVSQDDVDAAHRYARGSAGGKATAKKRREPADDGGADQYREFAEGHTGLLVALWLPPSAAEQLALTDGVAAEALHVTLASCGDVADLDELRLTRAIAAVDRAVSYRAPLEGQVAGYGRFNASPTSDAQDVFYAAVDVPDLTELRECIANELTWAGCPPRTTHGYTPHVTLAYLDPDAPNPVEDVPSLPLRFAAVTVMIGERRIDIPLGGFGAMMYSAASSGLAAVPPGFVAAVRPLLFSLDQEWIAYLPAPGNYFHTLYGAIDLTPERLSRIVDNFNGNVYGQDIPINCEHDGRAAGAVGWITPGNMRLAADGSIEVKPAWNERGLALLDGDRFRYVSAEFAYDWQDPVTGVWHQDVAQGLAICTRPHFKTDVLKSLAASEATALALVRAGAMGPSGQRTEEERTVTDKDQNQHDQPEPVRLSDDEVKAFRAWQTGREAETKKMADLEASVTSLGEANAKLVADAQTEQFTNLVMGRGKEGDGAVWAGGIQENIESLRRLAAAFGEDSDEFRAEVALRRTTAKQLAESGLFSPIGASDDGDGASAWDQIEAKAREMQASEPALSLEQATARTLQRHPELHRQYLTEERQR